MPCLEIAVKPIYKPSIPGDIVTKPLQNVSHDYRIA